MGLEEMIELIRLLVKYGAVVEEDEDKQDDVFAVARAALDRMRQVWGYDKHGIGPDDTPF